MSGRPVAGTFRLDGMLQGPLPPEDDTRANMQAWTGSAIKEGLHFHLSADGGNYTLVADPSTQKTSRLKSKGLDELLADGLNSLLGLLPPEAAAGSFSTIRSEEFRPGTAVQTLFPIGPDGRVHPEERTLDADTEEPPPEITRASLRKAIVPTLITVLLFAVISSFFIDYRKMFSDAKDRVVPLSKEEVVLKQPLLGDYLKVELIGIDNKKNALLLRIHRGSAWQRAIDSSPQKSAPNWPDFVTQLAIHQRRIRVELFNKENKPLLSQELDISTLHEKESLDVAVIAHLNERISKIVIRP